MRKFIAIIVLATVFSLQSQAQKTKSVKPDSATIEKRLKVELTQRQWQAVLSIMDDSNSSHVDVITVQKWLLVQLNPQIDSTAKKK